MWVSQPGVTGEVNKPESVPDRRFYGCPVKWSPSFECHIRPDGEHVHRIGH